MIDIHTHLAYKDFFSEQFIQGIAENTYDQMDADKRGNISKDYLVKIVRNNLLDVDGTKMISQMDAAGIEKSVLLIVDFFYKIEDIAFLEEIHKKHYEIAQKWNGRFEVFSGIDPRRGKKGLDLFEKSIREYNVKGLKLYPPCGFELDDTILYPYYEICEEYNIPVLAHIGPSVKFMRLESNFPNSVFNVAKKYPKVNFILGHAGILFYEEGIDLCKECSNVFVDVSGFQLVANDVKMVQSKLLNYFNYAPNQILFGTDWPMFSLSGMQKKWIQYFESMTKISEQNLELFFNKNSLSLLDN